MANGSSGSANTDARFNGIMAINDFGQAIMSQQSFDLFTPSVPHGSTGTFTQIAKLPGGLSSALTAINNNGTVVGNTCVPTGTGSCSLHAFVWTPASPNGSVGAVTEIGAPAGFSAITPTALNASGQVVGVMFAADGSSAPFLYANGTAYDLSALSVQLRGASPAGINDIGQIVLNSSGGIFLLTPGAPSAPPGSVAISILTAPGQPVTVAGTGCSAGSYAGPQTLYWVPVSSCTVAIISPFSSSLGTRFTFAGWTDGVTANPRVFVAPPQPAIYAAAYSMQFYLNATSSPAAGGSVTGSGWYAAGSMATITATPAAGYRLLDWTPAVAAAGALQAGIIVSNPQTVTANFVPLTATVPGNYQVVTVSGTGPEGPAYSLQPKPINQYGQVTGNNGGTPFLWTPAAANGTSGGLTRIPGVPGGASDAAFAINDRGQIAGATVNASGGQPFLWSPATPNGTVGTSFAFLGSAPASPPPGPLDINNYGQISGQSGGSPFIWTPASANGTTGSSNSDGRLTGIAAINDFGQAIMNGTPALFTPSSAHGASGSFTLVFGLVGASATVLSDINANGTIAGSSCIPAAVGAQCVAHAFLWMPSVPNGTIGAASEIPIPPGAISLSPVALNNRGQVVGTMTLASGITTPFLYSGGSVYDLANLRSQLRSGSAVGINDRGQIVVSSFGVVYLLSSTVPQLPAAVSVDPGAASDASKTMTFTFSDPRGWQDLDVVNILINNFLDAHSACYLAYSRPSNVLYLVNDAGTNLLPGVVLSGPGTTANGQCTVTASGAPVGSGNTLTLVLNVAFNTSFAGNKVVYLAARDVAQNNSGWQALGTYGVPGGAPTPAAVGGVTPARSTGAGAGMFAFTFIDTNGWQDLGVVNILINDALNGNGACFLAYSRPLNTLYLVNDLGDGLLPGFSFGSTGTLGNSQCTVIGAGSSMSGSGNILTLTLNMAFSPTFTGNRVIYMAARSNGDVLNSGWQAVGSRTVQ
jgi:probable HAF family extracellular repeat protein